MVFEHDYAKYPELSNQQIADFGFSSPHVQLVEDFDAVVERVVDGDTVSLSTFSRDFNFPLRLLGVDAPELSEGGQESRDWLKARIEGENVKIFLNRTQRVGKYGRLLGRVLHRGLDVGEEMVHLGLAKPFSAREEGKLPSLHKMFNLRQWLRT